MEFEIEDVNDHSPVFTLSSGYNFTNDHSPVFTLSSGYNFTISEVRVYTAGTATTSKAGNNTRWLLRT